ncbi:uncharacterized protein LOC109507699 isoform X2 [Hippocampus comes]|uniref:uncharacterized protein LOC109507699 isoform X2 n=1 Tax=Hippocampus comes TaxID=109280 RepID=UPI00094E02AF|nr:PREDICTED: uncharacterized protein LOC109507699 isoform X2 [Hippocampus comes]
MERRLTRSALAREHQKQRAERSDNAQLERQRGTESQTLDSVITGRGHAATATKGPKNVKKRRSDPGRRQEAHDDGGVCQKRVNKTVKKKKRMFGRHGLVDDTSVTHDEEQPSTSGSSTIQKKIATLTHDDDDDDVEDRTESEHRWQPNLGTTPKRCWVCSQAPNSSQSTTDNWVCRNGNQQNKGRDPGRIRRKLQSTNVKTV